MEPEPTSEQPSQDSAPTFEQRVENIFDNAPQEQPEEAQPEAEAQPETFEYEYEGEKFVLPKKLEKSVMQERDYTQKSQTLAEKHRAIELKEQQSRSRELESKFHTEVSADIRQLQLLDEVLKQPVNWQGMTTDEAFRHKIQLDDLRTQREQLSQSVTQKYNQFREKQQSEMTELQKKTLETVRSRISNWNDQLAKEVTSHFSERGLTQSDFALFNTNPELIVAAWESMQYRKLQSQAKPAVQQAKSVKTTSSNPMSQETKDKLNFRKTMQRAPQGSQQRRQAIEARVASIFGK